MLSIHRLQGLFTELISLIAGIHEGTANRNLAFMKPTWQSSTFSDMGTSDNAVDGCMKNTYRSACCMQTRDDWKPWWEVDLGQIYNIGEIIITKKWGGC